MPFRLTNAPTTFQQLMETCLRDLNLSWCVIYFNDIVIFSKDPTCHLIRLEAMFQKLEQAGPKLKPSKCELFCRQITYLGYIISAQGVVINGEKINVLKKWPNPIIITEVWSFLGFTRYYHWFIPKFTQIALPLYELTSSENAAKMRVAITWNDRCQQSFDELKCLCTTVPILTYADFTKPLKLHTNACGSGLYQTMMMGLMPSSPMPAGVWPRSIPIYPAHKLEFLILKWAVVKKFHRYLYGSAFDVYSNNNPPMYILTTAKLDTASHHWVASLANCNFQLYYRVGKANVNADALSRVALPMCIPNTFGTHHWVTAVAVQAVQEAAIEGPTQLIKVYSCDLSVMDWLEEGPQVTCMTAKDWQQAQLADLFLGQVIAKMQGETLGQCQCKQTDSPEFQQLLWECNHLKLRQDILYSKGLPRGFQKTPFQL